jgi:hypothetical protein
MQTTRWANKQHGVLPGTNQHSPLDRLTPTQGKRKKNLNNKHIGGKKKRHIAKRAGHPELQRVGEGHSPMWIVNKQSGQRRQEWRPLPSNLGVGKAWNSGCREENSPELGKGYSFMWTVNKQARQRRQVWRHLPQWAWRGEGVQQQLKCGTLHKKVGERHLPMQTLNKKGLQL